MELPDIKKGTFGNIETEKNNGEKTL